MYHLQVGNGVATFGAGPASVEHVRMEQSWETAVAVATEQVIVSVGRRIHHKMSLKRKRSLVFGDGLAPERNPGVHFARNQTAFKDQSKVLVGFLRQQVSAGLRSILLSVPSDDDAIFDGEILVGEPFPAIQIFAVEKCDRDLAPWNFEDLFLAPVIRI